MIGYTIDGKAHLTKVFVHLDTVLAKLEEASKPLEGKFVAMLVMAKLLSEYNQITSIMVDLVERTSSCMPT